MRMAKASHPGSLREMRYPSSDTIGDLVNGASEQRRKVGRPISIPDDEIFGAVYRVLARYGPGRVSLAAVATEVGASGPALNKRFGSRRGLLLAFSTWAIEITQTALREARADTSSPLRILRTVLLMRADDMQCGEVSLRDYTNVLQFYLGEASDPDIRRIWRDWVDLYEVETSRLLHEAIQAGELREDCDPVALGRALHAAITGIVILQIGQMESSSQERMREVFNSIIAPYLRIPGD